MALTGSQLFAAPPSDADDGATGAAADGAKAVTLLTGDRVYVDGRGNVARIQMAEGREHLRTSVRRAAGRTLVVPEDAQRLLAQGRLDARLFDVDGLVKAGLDDAGRDQLPLIVSYKGAQASGAKSRLSGADVSVKRSLPAVGADAVRAERSGTPDVWDALTNPQGGDGLRTTAAGVERVWLDGQRKVNLDRSVKQVGAPAAWDKGFEGDGVKVAVLDTGVDADHPDLADQVAESENFSDAEDDVDRHGHGTHVASTIAGTGKHADGRYRGVAPGSSILAAKVLDDDGFGDESGIIAGMEWAAEQDAKVANLSLGGEDTPENDPLEQAVDKLSKDNGILFVIAAGNEGPEAKSVGSPGSAKAALTVGAVDRDGEIADFSSVGPTADGTLKPDLTAPGVDIAAAQADGTEMGEPAADGYVTASGTSMATPHVAGAAALLAEQNPKWGGARLKQALASSAKPADGLTPTQQGSGQVDVSRAVEQGVVSVQTSVSFGTQEWPHDDDKELTKTVRYRNLSDKAVTLDLSTETTGPKGKVAPKGMFTLSETELTVPAKGKAEVSLTADTRVGDVDGHFGGHVVASTGTGAKEQTVRTAFGVEREVESYDLTLTTLNSEGAPAAGNIDLYGLDEDIWEMPSTTPEKNTVKVRLPKGSYSASAMIENGEGEGEDAPGDLAMMVNPRLSLSKDTSVTYDARKAKPISITAPQKAAFRGGTVNYVAHDGNGGGLDSSLFVDSVETLDGLSLGQVGKSVPADWFDSSISGLWTKGTSHYNLLYGQDGSFFNGFRHTVKRAELAEIDLRMGASAEEQKYGRVTTFWMRDGSGMGIMAPAFELPGATKQYVTHSAGYGWEFNVEQMSSRSVQAEPELGFTSGEARAYKPGKKYRATYNVGVVSPRVTKDASAAREGNDLYFCLPVFADGAGNGGFSETTSERTRLTSSSGTHFDEKSEPCDSAEVPAANSRYKLSTTAKRDTGIAGTSTHTYARWTFASAKPAGDEAELPLSSVGFAPKLDMRSSTDKRGAFSVPLTVDGPAAGKVGQDSLKVQVSYDDGDWQNAKVTKDAKGKQAAQLTHPKDADSVSLRVALKDKEGNTFLSTTRNAYLLR